MDSLSNDTSSLEVSYVERPSMIQSPLFHMTAAQKRWCMVMTMNSQQELGLPQRREWHAQLEWKRQKKDDAGWYKEWNWADQGVDEVPWHQEFVPIEAAPTKQQLDSDNNTHESSKPMANFRQLAVTCFVGDLVSKLHCCSQEPWPFTNN